MLQRDRERFAACARRADVLPLGSGALAGTGFAVDREALARDLGFAAVSPNSLDAVSDRDFAAVGVDADLVPILRRVATEDELYSIANYLPDAQAVGSLPEREQHAVVEQIVRREIGVMALACAVVVFLALRAAGTAHGF